MKFMIYGVLSSLMLLNFLLVTNLISLMAAIVVGLPIIIGGFSLFIWWTIEYSERREGD